MDIDKVTEELKQKYPDAGIHKIEIDEKSGKSTFYVDAKPKTLAFLERGGVVPKAFKDKAAVVTRDTLERTFLDIAQLEKDPLSMTAEEYFKAAIDYYKTDPLLASSINTLANLASKGFEHDIDDPNIKNFFDVWAFDVNFHEFLEWVFFDFFRTGHVTTYKAVAKYEPRVSYLSPIPGQKIKNGNNKKNNKTTGQEEVGAAKKIWSKGHLPIRYTVLNPLLVNIEGNLMFDKVSVKLTPPTELADLLKKPTSELTEEEKELIKQLPSDLKRVAEEGGELLLDSRLVGFVTYRKQPYERYAYPRCFRLFDSFRYKKALKQADLSTLDGITNYILVITIGNDEYPVVSQEELEAVSQLFNTPGKSFDVVWNHTLEVKKIVSPEIEAILGKEKYDQVNDDISAGLSIPRALIDGSGDLNVAQAQLAVKAVQEEIEYARRQVTRWIYREYRQIAEAMGFERFPRVRWDEGVLKDTIMYMNIISQLVDRRMLSYRTALEQLGFDYTNEQANMEEEFPLVQDGIFGIIGSPWQQAKVQPVQGAPQGTPSDGRPEGKPAKEKQPQTNPQKKNQTKTNTNKKPLKQPKQTVKGSLGDVITEMNEDEFLQFQLELGRLRNKMLEEKEED